jgi:hypothetical protein
MYGRVTATNSSVAAPDSNASTNPDVVVFQSALVLPRAYVR